MEEYTELVKFRDGERIVVAHVFKNGRTEYLRDFLEDFNLPPHKGRVRASSSVSPVFDGVMYLMGISVYLKDRTERIQYMSDEDYNELCLQIENHGLKCFAEQLGYSVKGFTKNADLSKLSFLNRCQPEMS